MLTSIKQHYLETHTSFQNNLATFRFVKIGSFQVKQSIQRVQSVDTS